MSPLHLKAPSAAEAAVRGKFVENRVLLRALTLCADCRCIEVRQPILLMEIKVTR